MHNLFFRINIPQNKESENIFRGVHFTAISMSTVFVLFPIRGLFTILLLLPWECFYCPWTFGLASAYLRNGALMDVAVFSCWASFSFDALSRKGLTRRHRRTGEARAAAPVYAKRFFVWSTWIALTCALSSLSVTEWPTSSSKNSFQWKIH